MRDIRRDIAEANEIAKFMNKEITFIDLYVSKFDEEGIYGRSKQKADIGDQQDEIQIKVENCDIG
jgi:hypothetical protein